MSESPNTNYTGQEYLEKHDSVSGAVLTLEQAVDNYVDTLGNYLAGEEVGDAQLEHSVDMAVDALERVYDAMDSFDEMLQDENMVARIQRDDKKGLCRLEENLERLSGGIYDEVCGFDDLLVLFEYVEMDSFEVDETHLQAASEHVEAPTKIVHDKDRIEELRDNLGQQYERLVHSEVIARQNTDDDINFDPEPPIFSMLGDAEYKDRVNRLNNEVKKLKQGHLRK